MKTETFKRIVWFRNDLRVYDNPALFRAAEDQQGVLAVYFICREMLINHVVAPVRVDFIRRHLLQLKSDLAELNIPLKVVYVDRTQEVIPHLEAMAEQYQVEELYLNAEYPLDEFNRDKQVSETLRAQGLVVKRFHDRNKGAIWAAPFLLAYLAVIGASIVGWLGMDTHPTPPGLAIAFLETALLVWIIVELGFLRGVAGVNRYGADPLAK